MEKLASLRAALVAAMPALDRDPHALTIHVDKGRLVSRRTASFGFEYRYQLRLFFEAFTGSPDAIMVPLLVWLRTRQPDLFMRFDREDDAIQFAADPLDQVSWDVAIVFELTEAVTLAARPGGWEVVHLPEPSPDDPLLQGALPEVPVGSIWLGDQQLLPAR